MNPRVDFYFSEAGTWNKEITLLRKIVLECGLTEELKWGCPCYQYQGRNVVLIHVFKEYCALLFFKGALLKDPEKRLVRQSPNVQAARQARITNRSEINRQAASLKALIYEAIETEKAGLKVPLKKTSAYTVPEEFQQRLKGNKELEKAFNALTPGRQRGYLLHFAAAKQASTREARITKYIPRILAGKGLMDQ